MRMKVSWTQITSTKQNWSQPLLTRQNSRMHAKRAVWNVYRVPRQELIPGTRHPSKITIKWWPILITRNRPKCVDMRTHSWERNWNRAPRTWSASLKRTSPTTRDSSAQGRPNKQTGVCPIMKWTKSVRGISQGGRNTGIVLSADLGLRTLRSSGKRKRRHREALCPIRTSLLVISRLAWRHVCRFRRTGALEAFFVLILPPWAT